MRFAPTLILLLICTSASAGVYKWTDENGKVHYSDVPPNTQPTEKVGITKTTGVEAPKEAAQSNDRKARVTTIGSGRNACQSLLSSASLKELRANGCGMEQAGCSALQEYLNEIESPSGRYNRRNTDSSSSQTDPSVLSIRSRMQAKGC